MVKKVKARGNGAYSAPHILEKPMVGHVTEGIEEDTSKGWHRRVGGSVDASTWGTDR